MSDAPKPPPFDPVHVTHDKRRAGEVWYSHYAAAWIVMGKDRHPRRATDDEVDALLGQ